MKDYVIVFFVIILFPLFFLLLLLLLYFSFINNIISIGSIPIKSIVKLRSKQKRERNDEKIVDSKITQKRKKNDEYKCQLCMNNLCATKWTISQILTIISWMPFSFFFFFYFFVLLPSIQSRSKKQSIFSFFFCLHFKTKSLSYQIKKQEKKRTKHLDHENEEYETNAWTQYPYWDFSFLFRISFWSMINRK